MEKKLEPSQARTVIETVSQFDLSKTSLSSSPPLSFSCLAITVISDTELLIYVGTDSGALLLLTLNPNFEDVELLRYVSVSHSPIVSIHVAAQIGEILVVSDGYVHLVDLQLLQPVKRLNALKGVNAVARRVCSSVLGSSNWVQEDDRIRSGKLLKRFGSGIRLNGLKVRDDGSSSVFAVALGKKVVLIELSSGDVDGLFVILKEMVGIDGVKTMAWVNDLIIFGTGNGYSLLSCITGQVNSIFSLPDMAASPCLKLLLKDHHVLLLVDNVGIIVNAHGQPVGGSLVFNRAPDCMAELSSYVVIVGDAKMELYHKRSGACVQALSLGGFGVGPCFVADEEDEHGRFIVGAASSKVFCYRKIPSEEQIKDLLRKKNFKEAISLAEELEAEGDMSNEILSFVHAQVGFLLLFDLHFEEAVDHFLQSETMHPSEIFPFIIRDPNRWSLLVPRIRYWGLHPPPAHIEAVVEDGLLAIQRAIFLKKAGVETTIDDQFLLNPPSRADLLDSAFRNIIRYLQVTRSKAHWPEVKEGVDTLLMYLYKTLNFIDDMEKLASSENSCVVEELETLLEESGHMRTLAFLYANKGMSSNALAIWRVLARSYSSGLHQENTDVYDLDDTSLPTSSKGSAAMEACKILEESVEQDLILQHLGWISEISEELAVQVLTSEKRINPLLPDNVIAAIDPRKVEILQRYLQWLIENQDSTDAQLHTLYALSLARSALETLKQDSNYDRGRNFPSDNPIRERLQIFLHSSDLYDAEEVLELIEGSELWLEKAILYRKLGQETLVLQILALKLEDSEAAEQYCSELGRPDAYMQLLDMYLNPHNGKEPMFKAAVHLLHNHGESLDPLQVLERLSPDMPLQLASETVLRMLRARHHHLHQGKLTIFYTAHNWYSSFSHASECALQQPHSCSIAVANPASDLSLISPSLYKQKRRKYAAGSHFHSCIARILLPPSDQSFPNALYQVVFLIPNHKMNECFGTFWVHQMTPSHFTLVLPSFIFLYVLLKLYVPLLHTGAFSISLFSNVLLSSHEAYFGVSILQISRPFT